MISILDLNRRLGVAFSFALAAIALLPVLTLPAAAQSQASGAKGEGEWKFTLAPYMMLPWMDGKTLVRGREVEVNVAPGAIFSNLQFGAMGAFEARKSKWGMGVDAIYMALGSTVEQPPVNVDFNQGAYAFTGLRQLNSRVELLFGARWNVLQGQLEFKGPLATTVKETKQWVDPIVGMKLKQPIRGRTHFAMQADIGGFGAGSKFAWHLFPMVGIDVGKRATLGMGYRVIGTDYQTGSQSSLFRYDVITQAFVLGAAFNY